MYDALEGLADYREMLDSIVAATGPVQGRVVVEAGCGTGNLLTRLLRAQPARLVGIDASAAMLAQAPAKLQDGLAAGRVELHERDAVAGLAELRPASVDVLVASNVLYALPGREGFWRAAARVLRPDGRVVVSNPDRPGVGPAVRQQWRTHGVTGCTDRRLLEVLLLNVTIDALALSRRYEFTPWAALMAEAHQAGLTRADLHGRCYGGPVDGMNVVGVFTRS